MAHKTKSSSNATQKAVFSTPLTGTHTHFKNPPKLKKRLTSEEEFDILKLVLDKILWLGFGIMALGLYEIYKQVNNPFLLMFAGASILVLFIVIMVREYEIVRN
ncbi:MAG: hypothetical protein AABX51_01915 [Nanoarchaeota archaeon]